MSDLYEWARSAVDDGELAVIVVRGAPGDRTIDGFTLEVTEEGHRDGVDTEELVEVVVKCHQWAEEKD